MSSKYEIRILSVQDQKLSKIKDSLRICAWLTFKATYKEDIPLFKDNLDFYKEAFLPAWKESNIIKMTMEEILQYLEKLGMTVEEAFEKRSEYYQDAQNKKARYKSYLKSKDFEIASEEESIF